MSKFTFICEEEPMPFAANVLTKRVFEFNAVSLNDVIQEFEYFLRGAGFCINGTLDIVPEEDYESIEEDEDNDGIQTFSVPQELDDWTRVIREDNMGHSHHYFDTERNK
jgi:hypothetical protein